MRPTVEPIQALAFLVAGLLPVTPVAAQEGRDAPLALAFTTSPCDERASIQNIARPKGRYFREISADSGVVALLDLGGPEQKRFHMMIAAYPLGRYDAEDGFARCQIVSLTEPTLALTDDFYFTSSSGGGGTRGARNVGPAAKMAIHMRRLDMTDDRYLVDTVTYIHLEQDTGKITFEIFSMGDPRKSLR